MGKGGPGSRTGAGTGGGGRNGTGGGDGMGRFRRGAGHGGPGAGRNRGSRSGLPDRVLFEGAPAIERQQAACVVCCVDDTDDLSGLTSTGHVAERIAEAVAGLGGAVVHGITRHQLLLADGIAYTSHNSAMCFMAHLPDSDEALARFREQAVALVRELSVPEADPGLCVAALRPHDERAQGAALTRAVEALVAFGHAAQSRICTKEEAYELAASIPWVSLSEHGGTGIGVIGALAGTGLRLEGCDGRFRGKWNLAHLLSSAEGAMAVGDFCDALERAVRGEVAVVDRTGAPVSLDARIALVAEAKPILHEGALTFVVDMRDDVAHPAEKVDLGTIGNSRRWEAACERFAFDTDPEERSVAQERSCRNCLYRRWTPRGFTCTPER